jgi:uncharacterized repeat protein (TIGR02543 family)
VDAVKADAGTKVDKPGDPAKSGYTFEGWYSAASGGTKYTWPHTLNAGVTMHAQWTPVTYTVAYNANGGNGSMAASTHTYGVPKNLTANAFTRTGHTFAGWNTAANGGGTNYSDGASVSNLSATQSATVDLYAQWWPDVSNITIKVNEDGNILVSNDDVALSKSGAEGKAAGFTAEVTGAYSGIQWYLYGDPVSGSRGKARTITIKAADYVNGSYYLGVTVTRNGVPYSTDIHFTVTN